jgi:hypothetical protein
MTFAERGDRKRRRTGAWGATRREVTLARSRERVGVRANLGEARRGEKRAVRAAAPAQRGPRCVNGMLGSANNMKSAVPAPQRRTSFILALLAYAPFLLWALIGAGWTLWRQPFSRWFLGAYLLVVLHGLIFKRSVGVATVMTGLAGCQMMAAFALHTRLRLPIWTVPAFFALSIALLIAVRVRAAAARIHLTKDSPYGH